MSVSAPQRQTLVGDLALGHHVIRDLLDRLDRQPANRAELAEELSICMASHSTSCMDSVLRAFDSGAGDYEQQIRLLHCATRGVNQLVDRLRLPARDPRLTEHVLVGLRALVREHERLELELLLAAGRPAA